MKVNAAFSYLLFCSFHADSDMQELPVLCLLNRTLYNAVQNSRLFVDLRMHTAAAYQGPAVNLLVGVSQA